MAIIRQQPFTTSTSVIVGGVAEVTGTGFRLKKPREFGMLNRTPCSSPILQ